MKSLLKTKDNEEQEKYNEIIRRSFSNIFSPQDFPEMGNENQAVEWLVKYTDVPFADQETLGLKVISRLINWEWGMKAFYANSMAVGYILNRAPKGYDILQRKYKIIQQTLQSRFFVRDSNVIDPIIGE